VREAVPKASFNKFLSATKDFRCSGVFLWRFRKKPSRYVQCFGPKDKERVEEEQTNGQEFSKDLFLNGDFNRLNWMCWQDNALKSTDA
jgi:hypothetical protein